MIYLQYSFYSLYYHYTSAAYIFKILNRHLQRHLVEKFLISANCTTQKFVEALASQKEHCINDFEKYTVGEKKGLKIKSMRVAKVMAIVLDWISVDSIVFDPVVPEIFYFKHHVGLPNYNAVV